MMKSRKTLAILIITILMLSITLTFIPVSAIAAPVLDPTSGSVGTKDVEVSGVSTTPGGLIMVYWDSVKDWDGTAGYLTSVFAVGTAYSVKITIPEAVAGDHYVIVKDVEAAEIEFTTFTVTPEIKLVPTEAIPGDPITVSGTGFATSTSVIVLYGTDTTTSTAITGTWTITGGTGTLTDVPIEPYDGTSHVTIVVTDSTPVTPIVVTFTDAGQGILESVTADCEGTINYLTGAVTLTIPVAVGMVETVTVTASYTYYITTTTVSTSTNALGSFSASLVAPATTVIIGALDSKGNEDAKTLTIVDQVITLTPEKGLIGTTVTVAGRGFKADGTVDIRWYIMTYPESDIYITLVADYSLDGNGDFSTTFNVPLVSDPMAPGSDYDVLAIDSENQEAEATFTVVEEASIIITPPAMGHPGDTFTVLGTWFTELSAITITFDGIDLEAVVTTDSNGAFTALDLEVPDVSTGVYTVTATDAKDETASASFTVLPPPIVVIETRATKYMQGDWISISGECTDKQDAFVVITDPDGIILDVRSIVESDWVLTDDGYVLPYLLLTGASLIFPLPSDAPLGNWNFTASGI